ncbi:MAG: hypothetical protein P8L86_04920 [Gammaproteobacteria bacterium]|nr:hypothetical protein [Gammaproteobacteria bacterium]
MTFGINQLQLARSLVIYITLVTSLIGNAAAFNHKTSVIKADIIHIDPIYMNYTLKKISTPCESGQLGCWNVSYQKRVAKVLKGYRVKLTYNNNTFTARMQNKPDEDHLKIRVKSDLLVMPNTVAINASVVY